MCHKNIFWRGAGSRFHASGPGFTVIRPWRCVLSSRCRVQCRRAATVDCSLHTTTASVHWLISDPIIYSSSSSKTFAPTQWRILHTFRVDCSVRRRGKNIDSSSKSNPLRRLGKNYDASTWRRRRRRRRRKNEESRRTFDKNSCDLLTAVTHTEILYKTNKQFNKNTKLWKQNGRCLDDVTTALVPTENWRKINMNF